MLLQLSIKNLAIVQEITLDFTAGMNVFTGETGAGKSILLDALNLTLGDRASPSIVRAKQKQAEISAVFDLVNLSYVQEWLKTQELASEADCIVRRIIAIDGPSKAYINGHMVTLAQLKQLGEMLVNMHGQHQHHALLEVSYQRFLLDQYSGHNKLLQDVANSFKVWTELQNEYKRLAAEHSSQDKLKLLNYQLKEIEELALKPEELQALDKEHKKLTKAEELLATINNVCAYIGSDTDQNIISKLHTALNHLQKMAQFAPELSSSAMLIQQAIIPLEEAGTELQHFVDTLSIDPLRLTQVEQRMSDIYLLARKHNIVPEFIHEHYKILLAEKAALENKNVRLSELQQKIQEVQDQYSIVAAKLSQSRHKTANVLTKEIEQQMRALAMPNAVFSIEVANNKDKPTVHGVDNIAFLVSTNPGQVVQSLNKIASGGELSRISLAIQVILTKKIQPSTLIFDEIDVGVSGATAEIVGQLLRVLGSKAQVLCVTHLPQVAAQGHSHFKVSKQQEHNSTHTMITQVHGSERVEELARLLGGTAITEQAIANAQTMLEAIVD